MKKRTFVLLVPAIGLFLASILAASGDASGDSPCGTVSYMVGKASITHNGKVVAADIDSPVYNNDMIKTEDKSKVEISVDKSTGFNGKVTVNAKTTFYFKTTEVKGQPSTTLDLMAGTVGMKVSKIAGSPSAQVRTDSAVCGVRGTEFSFSASPGGDVLVTCASGQVGLLDTEGDEALVDPGMATEKQEGQAFKSVPVSVSSLDEFRDNWYAERIQALAANPVKALKQYSAYYLKKKADFLKSYALLEKSAAFARWRKEDSTPGFKVDPKAAQTMKDLKEVDGPILSIRKDLFLFERYYYRLVEIRDLVKDGAAWQAEIGKDDKGKSITAAAFYKVFDADRDALGTRMAMFRYAEKLHLKRNPSGATGKPGGADESAAGGLLDSGSDDSFFND
jgi:hypothetical protein